MLEGRVLEPLGCLALTFSAHHNLDCNLHALPRSGRTLPTLMPNVGAVRLIVSAV
jgi:hypothetical protein